MYKVAIYISPNSLGQILRSGLSRLYQMSFSLFGSEDLKKLKQNANNTKLIILK